MLFHTWPFLVFFTAFYALYLALRSSRLRLPLLLGASYVFYGWWNPLYLVLIIYSTLVDYLAVLGMSRGGRKKAWLVLSLLNNLFLLGFFKYGGFVVENLNEGLVLLGPGWLLPEPDVLLPVGISFYTFQSMSYTIDYWRGKLEVEPSFIRFAAFVALFPQLVAGPIERASSLLPQLKKAPRITARDAGEGLSLFVVGLFKKVALANYLALYVDRVYANPVGSSSWALLCATFFFAWQIYFDFSGYTDMARGIARMLGIRLMVNFNNPYLAVDLGDFWRRWHISLSTWFRDYVYIPLGGSRGTRARTMVAIALTMVISGLWHGAAWTFVAWGALHAAGRLLTLPVEKSSFYRERVPRLLKQLLVFSFVLLTWIFFRAESLADAWLILGRILAIVPAGFGGAADPLYPLFALLLIFAVWAWQLLYESSGRWLLELQPVRVAAVILMIIYLALVPASGDEAFIYFQF